VTSALSVARPGRGSTRSSPVPPSGFLPLSAVSAYLTTCAVKSPTPRGLVACRSRPWSLPLQSFPFPGSRTRSRGPLASLRVRLPTENGAVPAGASRPLSPLRASPLPLVSALRRTTGRMSRDDGSLRSLVRSPRPPRKGAARAVLFLPRLGSPFCSRHARFEALLPPGVRSATTLALARQGPSAGALLGSSTLQSSLHLGSGSGLSQIRSRGVRDPDHARLRAPNHRGCMPRPGLRHLGSRAQDPSIRRIYRTPRITVEQRPSSPSASRALAVRQPPAPSLRPAGRFGTERLARAPSRRHPAPPCPSRSASSGEDARRWTSKTLFV